MKIIPWSIIHHYKISDFDSPDTKKGGDLMDMVLVHLLDCFEHKYKHHFIITSAFRSPAHNLKVGGVPNSAHTRGKAVDVSCDDSALRYKLIYYALSCGIKRIGISKIFIHFATDDLLPYPVIWLY
jgi:hypothetical protein